jgi:propanol-preferring alcohol dehydrogenase
MRAMVVHATGLAENSPLVLEEVPVPEPGAGEVRLRVSRCGVCHTDLHIVEGDLTPHLRPVIPGHQVVGYVDAVGTGVRSLKPGDRVGVPWLYSTCGKCIFCLHGQENLCERAQFTGYDVNGGYAEYMVAREEFVCALPTTFSDDNAAPLLCAGIIGYRAYRLSGARPGDRIGLYGFGASGHITLQFARHLGCEVFVFTRAEAHRQLARELGAARVAAAGEPFPGKLDSAIIFAPAGQLVIDALRALRKGGTVALAGITMSAIPQMDYADLYHERVIRSVANSTRQDAREFLDLAADVPIITEVETFALEQANEALTAMKHSKLRGAGVLTINA